MWFDAFRKDYGPTWYGENRTPVVTDTTTVTIVIVFAIFLVAFLVIFPGIRRERWSSFFSVTLTLSVGAILLVCIHHPCWHVGEVKIHSTYKAFSPEKLDALLGVRVGLKHVNITLRSWNETPDSHHHFDYNERFHFTEVKSMEKELAQGLQKGLPYPILSVIEYLSVDRAGFIWGRQYRLSGYYTCILLWLSFSLWVLQVLMLCLVPQYFSRTLLVVGSSIGLADIVYVLSSPRKLFIRFPDAEGEMTILSFYYGWCLWATIGAGACCLLMGLVIRILEAKSLYHFVTFLQADFDEVTRSPKARGEPSLTHPDLYLPKTEDPTPSPSSLSGGRFVDKFQTVEAMSPEQLSAATPSTLSAGLATVCDSVRPVPVGRNSHFWQRPTVSDHMELSERAGSPADGRKFLTQVRVECEDGAMGKCAEPAPDYSPAPARTVEELGAGAGEVCWREGLKRVRVLPAVDNGYLPKERGYLSQQHLTQEGAAEVNRNGLSDARSAVERQRSLSVSEPHTESSGRLKPQR